MISWRDEAGRLHQGSLFKTFAALSRGEAWSFPALRPHQREPWHAFTVQVAALALIQAELDSLPQDEAAWRERLVALSNGQPEAWELVVDDWSKPALLQPPLANQSNRADYKSKEKYIVRTPDALDMLVTPRNHEMKAERIAQGSDEDWLFALVTLQTNEGSMGAGNYGVSRMFGGYGNRMSLGVRPRHGGAAMAFKRDVLCLVLDAKRRADRRQGMSFLWTEPWDGIASLAITKLDELCVEVCRRIRLRRTPGGLQALRASSERMRVAAESLGGNVQDPWIPLIIDEKKARATFGKLVAFTPTGTGFGYRQMSRLLDKSKVTQPMLAKLSDEDEHDNLLILAAALARGQGGTEGLHRRAVSTYHMKELYEYGPSEALDRVGEVARTRSDEAGQASKRLRRALIMLMSGGKDREDLVSARDGDAENWTVPLRRYDQLVDQDFFGEPFWIEAVTGLLPEHRQRWRQRLRTICEKVLAEAAASAPRTEMRRFEALARAENKLKALMDAWLNEVADVE